MSVYVGSDFLEELNIEFELTKLLSENTRLSKQTIKQVNELIHKNFKLHKSGAIKIGDNDLIIHVENSHLSDIADTCGVHENYDDILSDTLDELMDMSTSDLLNEDAIESVMDSLNVRFESTLDDDDDDE